MHDQLYAKALKILGLPIPAAFKQTWQEDLEKKLSALQQQYDEERAELLNKFG